MADTRDDINSTKAMDRLQAQRQPQPCEDYEQAARWLGDWCLCGWEKEKHGEQP